ncbi:MAG: type VI secretion protein IcmF/TssM N-terminal domain-containing protein [Thermodesulfobacteriota bacterium]
MKALLKGVLVGGVTLAGGSAALAAYVLGWTPVQAGLLFGAVAVLGAAGVVLMRLLRARRKAALPEAPSAADAGPRGKEAAERRKALDARWKTFVGQLRRAKVKGRGDPVYALPWYLFLGEDGAGKTTAVENSLLAVSGGQPPREEPQAGGSFGWRVLEEGIVLDAPGRYAFPRDPLDEAEWAELCSLLVRTRKEEPLNGVLLAVPAGALLSRGDDELRRQGAALGKRLDELTRTLGAVAPVYVLVTQCDLVGGMARFFGNLPENAFAGAMGGLNDDRALERPQEAFPEQVFGRLYRDLRQLRLTLLGDVPPDEVHPQAVLFPEEFLELKAPLGRFLEGVFEKNPYREPPFFRGLYFTSARQAGTPASACLTRLGLQDEILPLAGESRSLFLKDFFGRVLPGDRALAAPTSRALSWRRLTQNAALAGWVLACVAVGVLLSLSFGRNLSTVRKVDREIPPRPYLGAEFGPNVELADQLRATVREARESGRAGVLPRLGLTQGEDLADRLAAVFVERYRAGVLDPLDRELDRGLLAVSDGKDPSRVARYVDYLSKRTKLLRLAAEGERSEEALAAAEQPDFGLVLALPGGAAAPALAEPVERGYGAYLAWRTDPGGAAKDLEAEQARLANLLAQKAVGFAWLVEWANLQESLRPVTLAVYWGAEPPPAAGGGRPVLVEPAYTPPGWQEISGFISTISRSVAGGEGLGAALNAFETSYRTQYLAQWERFLREFRQGAGGWTGRQKRIELAGRLAGPESPYQRVMADAAEGLAPAVGLAKTLDDVPEWVSLLYRWERLGNPEYQKALKGAEGVMGRLVSRGGKVLADLRARFSGQADEARVVEQDTRGVALVAAYQESLRQMAAAVQAPAAAYQAAREAYVEAETRVGEPQQPVSRNAWAQARLSSLLSQGRPREAVFWQLLAEPTSQVWGVMLDEAQVHLQQRWEAEVLAEAKTFTGWEQVGALLGEGGKVWAFQSQYVDTFVAKDPRRGFVPKRLHNDSLTFSGGFLGVSNLGKLGGKAFERSYRVQIAAVPTSANPGATVQPHRTRLVLQCAAENQELVNLNYPIEKTFSWTPGECSDTVLEIAVGDAVLLKRYSGHDGFIAFLKDFQAGTRTFRAEEFPPEQSRPLAGYQVRNLTVGYTFKGHAEALRLAVYDPNAVPAALFE